MSVKHPNRWAPTAPPWPSPPLRLIWEPEALDDLATAAEWSALQVGVVVDAMERMAALGFSLGRPTGTVGVRYWPVPPLGVSTPLPARSCTSSRWPTSVGS